MGDEKESRHADEEQAFLPQPEATDEQDAIGIAWDKKYILSVLVNIGAAVGLVFVNKRIFEDEALRHAQVTFAALHFAITAATLYAVSVPRIGMFQRKRVPVLGILPLALAMIASVVLTNASLAFSSIQFYQVVRVLTTPCVALLEYIVLGKKITIRASLTLIPVCVGVGIVSYFDTSAKTSSTSRATSPLGVFFAFVSLFATATYSVWIKKYHQTTGCESAQLLLNQAPVSVLVMLYIIPFSDDVTVWKSVSASTWSVILISGVLACLLHISQFNIINRASPIASTVVGHAKTCLIIAIGWAYSGKALADGSMVGIVLAVGGIIAHSYVTAP
ncbi:TPT-domain-containing protein [Hortaea werneckii]|nr:TPT-domain-containing protein [Hortaea werneckii]KAI7222754.1 TPT-domain-containing protein [Hortaea werneckii]